MTSQELTTRVRQTVLGSQEDKLARGLILLNLFFLFCRPQDFPGLGVLISAAKLNIPLFLLVAVLYLRKFKASLNTLTKALLLLLGIHAVLIFVGRLVIHDLIVNDGAAFARWRNLAQYFLCFLFPIIPYFISGKALRQLMTLLLFCALYLAFWGLTHGGRGPSGFVADENDLCLVLIGFLSFSLTGSSVYRTNVARLASLAVSGLIILSIVATQSRGGFLGLVAMFMIYIPTHPQRFKILAASVFLFFAALPFVPDKYYEEVRSIFTTSTQEGETGAERLDTWGTITSMWLDPAHIVQGVGIDNTPWRMVEYESADRGLFRKSLAGRQAHSTLFQIIGDLGLIGITIIGYLVYRSLNELRKLRKAASKFIRARAPSFEDEDKQKCYRALWKEYKFVQAYTVALAASFVGSGVAALFISTLYYPTLWFLLCVNETTILYGKRLAQLQRDL